MGGGGGGGRMMNVIIIKIFGCVLFLKHSILVCIDSIDYELLETQHHRLCDAQFMFYYFF